jgi:hypothetical protein
MKLYEIVRLMVANHDHKVYKMSQQNLMVNHGKPYPSRMDWSTYWVYCITNWGYPGEMSRMAD